LRAEDVDHVVLSERVRSGMVTTAALGSALAALVVADAPQHGCVVLHAAGVRVDKGVVLLTAPSGTGKTTLAKAAGTRAFAYNAVLVQPGPAPRVWPLPFSGGGDPPIRRVSPLPLRAVLALERAEHPTIRTLPPSRATILLVQSVVRPIGSDGANPRRETLALALAGVPCGRLGSPPTAEYLRPVASWLGAAVTK
jgi:hypothetical protein